MERIRVNQVFAPGLQEIFPFNEFNEMQSCLLQQILETNQNMVIGAPSGSGKTVLLELAICRAYMVYGLQRMKCIYIAPNKALCQQRWCDWNNKFSKIGLKVLELTGDTDIQNYLKHISEASIIITTPEKWDSITRCWRNHTFLLCGVNLFLIDETHHLAYRERGAVLEAVIVRMMLVAKTKNWDDMNSFRIIALSATLPNLEDIGDWLKCRRDFVHDFNETYRPVPLQIKTIAYNNRSNPYLFEKSLDDKVKDVIRSYSEDKSTIVFCSSKKNAENQANKLCQQAVLRYIIPPQNIQNEILKIQDVNLRALTLQGYGFHHGGLNPDDRTIIEELFQFGYVRILCSTSTLAQGMNFPAHLVILKGTCFWRGSNLGFQRITRSEVIQMLGRAGRPGYDVSGRAVIMTSKEDERYFDPRFLQADQVESQLDCLFLEAIGAEISQATITNLHECIEWFKLTLFYVRLTKCVDVSETESTDINTVIIETCKRSLKTLKEGKLITFDETSTEWKVEPLPEIHVMSRNMTRFYSMIQLLKISKLADIRMVLHYLSQCEELHKPLKRTDKSTLNSVMKNIRFTNPNQKVKSDSDKSFILIQLAISEIELLDFSLRAEQAEMVESSIRLLRALKEISILHENGKVLESCLILDRSLHKRIWEWSQSNVYAQCQEITQNIRTRLKELNLHSFESVCGMSAAQISSQTDCSLAEAEKILNFTNIMLRSKLTLSTTLRGQQLIFKIQGTHDKNLRVPLSYELISYDATNGNLICYRNNIIADGFNDLEFQVNMKTNTSLENIRSTLLCCVVGLDYTIQPLVWNGTTRNGEEPASKKRRGSKTSTLYDENSSLSSRQIPASPKLSQRSTNKNPFDQFKFQAEAFPKIELIDRKSSSKLDKFHFERIPMSFSRQKESMSSSQSSYENKESNKCEINPEMTSLAQKPESPAEPGTESQIDESTEIDNFSANIPILTELFRSPPPVNTPQEDEEQVDEFELAFL